MSSIAQLVLEIVGKDSASAVLKSVGAEAEGFSGKLNKGVVAGGAAAGTALVAMGGLGAKAFTDINQAQNDFQAGLGVTRDEAKALGDVATAVYRDNFGGSVQDAAAVITQAFQVIGDVGDESLKSITENALRLQDSFGVETAESIDAVKTLMDNFGVSADQAFDLLAEGYQKGLNRSADFLDTIGEYSVQFKNGGATAEQFFGLLESGLQGGMLGTDKAADAFKEFQVRILDGSKSTATAMEGLGLSSLLKEMETGQVSVADGFGDILDALRDIEDPAQRMQLGVALIGTQFEDLGAEAATNLSLVSSGFGQNEQAIESLDAKYNNLSSRLEGYKRQAELFLAPIAGHAAAFLPQIAMIGQSITGLSPIIGQVGPAFVAMNAIAGPALRSLGMAMITPPLGIVIAIAAVLIAAYLFRDEIAAAFQAAWNYVQPILQAFYDGTVGKFDELWTKVKLLWQDGKEAITTKATEAKEAVVGKVTELKDGVIGAIQGALDWVKGHWPEIATIISGPFFPIVALATDAFGVRSALVGAFEAIWGALTDWGGRVLGWFTALPGEIVGALGDLSSLLFDAGKQIVQGLLDGIQSMFGAVKGKLGELTGLVPDWKGPADVDRMLLFDSGRMIIGGLIAGFQAEEPNVQAALQGITAGIGQAGAGMAGAGAGGGNASIGQAMGVGGASSIVGAEGEAVMPVQELLAWMQRAPEAAMGYWNQLNDGTRQMLAENTGIIDAWRTQGVTIFEDYSIEAQNSWEQWTRFANLTAEDLSEITGDMTTFTGQSLAVLATWQGDLTKGLSLGFELTNESIAGLLTDLGTTIEGAPIDDIARAKAADTLAALAEGWKNGEGIANQALLDLINSLTASIAGAATTAVGNAAGTGTGAGTGSGSRPANRPVPRPAGGGSGGGAAVRPWDPYGIVGGNVGSRATPAGAAATNMSGGATLAGGLNINGNITINAADPRSPQQAAKDLVFAISAGLRARGIMVPS